MEEFLELQSTLHESLFVGVTHDQLKLPAIGLDAIRPEVVTHEPARVFKLLGHPRQSYLERGGGLQIGVSLLFGLAVHLENGLR